MSSRRFRGPEALRIRTFELRPPGSGEVTIEVRADQLTVLAFMAILRFG